LLFSIEKRFARCDFGHRTDTARTSLLFLTLYAVVGVVVKAKMAMLMRMVVVLVVVFLADVDDLRTG
jgi:hypothetical protein